MHVSIDNHTIKELMAGEVTAFNYLYASYAEKVYRLAFRFLKNREQSEEIVQETFINLWQSRSKLDPDSNIWLYLYVIAKRLCLNQLREISKSGALREKLLFYIDQARNTTEEAVLAHELEAFTQNAILKLPKQQQLIFKMSRVDGLSHQEIADQLQISPNTVKNHIVEALKKLRSDFKYPDLIYLAILAFIK